MMQLRKKLSSRKSRFFSCFWLQLEVEISQPEVKMEPKLYYFKLYLFFIPFFGLMKLGKGVVFSGEGTAGTVTTYKLKF